MKQECDKTEEEIYLRLKTEQSWAIKCLFDKYSITTTAKLYQEDGLVIDKKDVFQEAVITLLSKMKNGEYEYRQGSMGGYLAGIVRLKWIAAQRRNRRNLRKEITEEMVTQWSLQEEELLLRNKELEQFERDLSLIHI